MNLELYGYALDGTLASRDEASLPEPEPPVEHASDCPCSECSGDPFLSRLVLAVVPEAHGRPEHTKSYQNPSIYAGSKASSGRSSSNGNAEAPPWQAIPEQGHEVVDSRELARRWCVPKSWVEEQTRRRCSDPIPHIRLGKYVRFEWGSPELERWWARRRKTRR